MLFTLGRQADIGVDHEIWPPSIPIWSNRAESV